MFLGRAFQLLVTLSIGSSFAAALSLSSTSAEPRFVLKSSTPAPDGWFKTGKPDPSHPITLRFALAQPNFPQLEEHLLAISDPSSGRWREHLSKEDVDALVAPHDESVQLLNAFLARFGLESNTATGTSRDWHLVETNISVAEVLLDAEYFVFEHRDTGKQVVRTTAYSVPEYLDDHIDVVQPTDYFGSSTRALASPLSSSFHGDENLNKFDVLATKTPTRVNITLQVLKELYSVGDYKPTGKHTIFGITGYLEQYANFADLKLFYEKFLPQATNSTPRIELVNGAINSQNSSLAGVEAALDVQYGGGLSYPIPNVFYSTAGRPPLTTSNVSYANNTNEPYDVFLTYLLAKKDHELPQTLSTSYGDNEYTVPLNYARRVCAQYAQAGARGVSVLHSSGDSGVGNGSPTECYCCGGTTDIPETAIFLSQGGFSDYFSRPSYQSKAVKTYLTKHLTKSTYSGLFNASGRGFPDVAAQANYFEFYYHGKQYQVGGTSAACPTFSALVALLNDALVAKGERPLGFLNPWLYSLRSGLNDITSGNNPGCGTPGFNATEGWDPATGLGTPNFAKLLQNVLSHPHH